MGINFIKRARCFKAKKVINHELEVHGYGGEEEDGENNDNSVCVGYWREDKGEEERMKLLRYL